MAKKKKSSAFAVVQQIGKSFFLPVSVLPIAGILLGLGSSFTNADTIAAYHLRNHGRGNYPECAFNDHVTGR